MRIGFFTACMPGEPLDSIAAWAAKAGFQAIEVAAWPADDPFEWHAAHVDAQGMTAAAARRLRRHVDDLGLEISALGFYANHLHSDPATRADSHRHLRSVIDAAAVLGVPIVGTFIGRDITRSVAENAAIAPEVLAPLVEHAGSSGVTLALENCLMTSWHPDGYPANLAYSPELWDWAIALGFSLNFDPSHLVTIGIDPVPALAGYTSHVAHVQAKDVEMLPERLGRYGYFNRGLDRRDPTERNSWRYRMPGRGQVDWTGVLRTLLAGGYDGTVSIEHEDPDFGGDVEAVRRGLELGLAHLSRARDAVLADHRHQAPGGHG